MNPQPSLPRFHPTARPYRFIVLVFASAILVGSYFAYDSVGAIESTLMAALGVDRAAIGGMYTMYSLAAIGAVLLGGMLLDRIGVRRASLLFSVLVTAGAALVALAPGLGLIYLGRLIFGVGSESLVVAQSAILARWFRGRELALSFGIALTFSRVGTLFSFNTEALIADRFGFRAALWTAAGLCLLSLLANLVYNFLDRRAEKALKLRAAGAGEKIVWKDLKGFKPSYWWITLLCLTFYSAIFPFTALATDFFHEKWGLPLVAAGAEGAGFLRSAVANYLHMWTTAGGTTSIIIFASMILAPFAGAFVDRVGHRAGLMVWGALMLIPCHLILGLTHWPPAFPMIVLGAAFVLVPAALWPAVPLIVEERRIGTAYGLMSAIQNIGLALFPWLSGQLRDHTHDYTAGQILFAGLGCLGLFAAVMLLRADRREGGKLRAAAVARL